MYDKKKGSKTRPENMRTEISEIGEFGLIDRITHMLPHSSPDVVVGIGDDVAVLKTSGPDYLLAT